MIAGKLEISNFNEATSERHKHIFFKPKLRKYVQMPEVDNKVYIQTVLTRNKALTRGLQAFEHDLTCISV